jgi:hypothetical protein
MHGMDIPALRSIKWCRTTVFVRTGLDWNRIDPPLPAEKEPQVMSHERRRLITRVSPVPGRAVPCRACSFSSGASSVPLSPPWPGRATTHHATPWSDAVESIFCVTDLTEAATPPYKFQNMSSKILFHFESTQGTHPPSPCAAAT